MNQWVQICWSFPPIAEFYLVSVVGSLSFSDCTKHIETPVAGIQHDGNRKEGLNDWLIDWLKRVDRVSRFGFVAQWQAQEREGERCSLTQNRWTSPKEKPPNLAHFTLVLWRISLACMWVLSPFHLLLRLLMTSVLSVSHVSQNKTH